MNRVNLLPAAHLSRLRRRRAVRRWLWIDGLYAAALAAAAGACWFAAAGRTAAEAAPSDAARLDATLAALRQQSATLDAKLASVREVTGRPDFGVMLAALADRLGDDAVLSSVDSAPAAKDTPDFSPAVFRLDGVARSQAAVTALVLRLEALGLFSRVQLGQTLPDATRGIDGVSFKLTCATEDKP